MMSEPSASWTSTASSGLRKRRLPSRWDRNSAPFLGYFCQIPQAEYLKASGIGQNRALPVHERVQAAELSDQFMTRPDKEMIGVAEDNLGAKLDEIFRGDGLDRRLGADRHENRGCEACHAGLPASPHRARHSAGTVEEGKRDVCCSGHCGHFDRYSCRGQFV